MGIEIKDGAAATKYLKATGTGADGTTNAYVPIHTLGANSGVDIGDVDVTSLPPLPAGSNGIGKLTANAGIDIGNVTSLLATDSLRNGTTAVTPAFAVINVASTGSAQEIVAGAGTDNKIRVLALNIVVGAAVNVYVASATSAITGAWEFNGKGDGIVLPFSPVGWFETAATEALNLFLSAGVSVDGSVTYVVVQ
jgi:hypothetical protein